MLFSSGLTYPMFSFKKDQSSVLTKLLPKRGVSIISLGLLGLIGTALVIYFIIKIRKNNRVKKISKDLFSECKSGNLEGVKKILQQSPELLNDNNVNEFNPVFKDCLATSCEYAHLEVVNFLLSKLGRLRNKRTLVSVLCLACSKKEPGYSAEGRRLEIVKALLAKGVKIHTASHSPLQKACKSAYLDIATYLVENGGNLNMGEQFLDRASPLEYLTTYNTMIYGSNNLWRRETELKITDTTLYDAFIQKKNRLIEMARQQRSNNS